MGLQVLAKGAKRTMKTIPLFDFAETVPLPHVLVVDDENGPRQALRMLLKEDYTVHLAPNVPSAIDILHQAPIQLVITDLRMPKQTGVDLLRETKALRPEIQVIILTGYGQLETAVKAVEYGAFTYMEKPFDNAAMLNMVQAGLERYREERDRRALEQLALEANRFETLGRVVTGMMHDLGTPLTVLGSQLEILTMRPTREDMPQRLATMQSQVRHCNEMVRSTMNFIRSNTQGLCALRLNSVVDACMEVAAPLFREDRVEPVLHLDLDLPEITGDLVSLRQAVLNLLANACQAMETWDGTREVHIASRAADSGVCLSIEDTGPGVAPALRERIFETFFTTKGKSGTGLGLSVVRNVMQRHGGSVRLERGELGGARFALYFPAVTK